MLNTLSFKGIVTIYIKYGYDDTIMWAFKYNILLKDINKV